MCKALYRGIASMLGAWPFKKKKNCVNWELDNFKA
jgi:hypothetical protein